MKVHFGMLFVLCVCPPITELWFSPDRSPSPIALCGWRQRDDDSNVGMLAMHRCIVEAIDSSAVWWTEKK